MLSKEALEIIRTRFPKRSQIPSINCRVPVRAFNYDAVGDERIRQIEASSDVLNLDLDVGSSAEGPSNKALY